MGWFNHKPYTVLVNGTIVDKFNSVEDAARYINRSSPAKHMTIQRNGRTIWREGYEESSIAGQDVFPAAIHTLRRRVASLTSGTY